MLCQIAAMIALAIVLERFLSFGPGFARVSFAFVPMALCAMLYGPVWGGIAFGLSDVIGSWLFSYGFWPGIVASRVLSGVIFGLFLHREVVKFFPHILAAALTEEIVCACGLTTLILSVNGLGAFFPLLIARLLPWIAITIFLQLLILPVLVRLRLTLRKAKLVDL